jgi:hypothetical protein
MYVIYHYSQMPLLSYVTVYQNLRSYQNVGILPTVKRMFLAVLNQKADFMCPLKYRQGWNKAVAVDNSISRFSTWDRAALSWRVAARAAASRGGHQIACGGRSVRARLRYPSRGHSAQHLRRREVQC